MNSLFVFIGMFLICPVFIIASNICFMQNDTKKEKIIKGFKLLLINPSNIYIYAAIICFIFITIFKIKYNQIFEYLFMILISLIFIPFYSKILRTNKKHLACLIYNSFVLIEITSVATLSKDIETIMLFITSLIMPSIVYILYYFLIAKPVSMQKKDIEHTQVFLANILPIIAEIIICAITYFEGIFYRQQSDVLMLYAFTTINYLFLIFEFVAYHIIFLNIEKTNEVIELCEEITQTQEQTIIAFAKATESKSEDTGGHVKRVSEYCKLLALKSGYNEQEAEDIRQASMLHDVGKIGIPDEILNKPGKLTNEEFDVIKTHVHQGANMLSDFNNNIMKLAKIIALQHHEKWDGTGYIGLSGEEIEKPARIAAIADVFDAICSKRCYKDSATCEEAKKIIIEGKGKHFDPLLVDEFEKNFAEFKRIRNQYN